MTSARVPGIADVVVSTHRRGLPSTPGSNPTSIIAGTTPTLVSHLNDVTGRPGAGLVPLLGVMPVTGHAGVSLLRVIPHRYAGGGTGVSESRGSPGGCGGNRWVADGLCAGAGRPVSRSAITRETGRVPALADRCAGEIVGPGGGTTGADPKCRGTPGPTRPSVARTASDQWALVRQVAFSVLGWGRRRTAGL
jgi:hypothetical protein